MFIRKLKLHTLFFVFDETVFTTVNEKVTVTCIYVLISFDITTLCIQRLGSPD